MRIHRSGEDDGKQARGVSNMDNGSGPTFSALYLVIFFAHTGLLLLSALACTSRSTDYDKCITRQPVHKLACVPVRCEVEIFPCCCDGTSPDKQHCREHTMKLLLTLFTCCWLRQKAQPRPEFFSTCLTLFWLLVARVEFHLIVRDPRSDHHSPGAVLVETCRWPNQVA